MNEILNCGFELGEIVDMYGEKVRIVDEDCDDPYCENPEWYPVTEPVED